MPNQTEQKIKNLQFKRNKTIYSSLEELIKAVKEPTFLQKAEIAEMQDGELLMFRYKDLSGNIATLVGSVYNPDSSTKEIHLEIGTDKIKKIIQEELKNIGTSGGSQSNVSINSADKILSLGSDNTLTASLNLVKSGDTLKLIGKNNLVISTITLPVPGSGTGTTVNSLSFKWLPQEAKLQLIGDNNKTLSEVDFPFETMVQSSELTTDNKLKLVFNTTKGPQSVLVDLNKLKDIYTAGDSTISVTGNKISTKVSSKTTSLPITKEKDGLWVNDAKLTETVNDLNSLKTKVNNLETGSGSGSRITYSSGDSVIEVSGSNISTKISSTATKLPLKKNSDGLWVDDSNYNSSITYIESMLDNEVVKELDLDSLSEATNSLFDASVLRFYHTGNDVELHRIVPKEMPFLEYHNNGKSTVLSIDQYDLQGDRETIVELVTKQDLAKELSKINTGNTNELTLDKLKPLLDQYHGLLGANIPGEKTALSFYRDPSTRHISNNRYALFVNEYQKAGEPENATNNPKQSLVLSKLIRYEQLNKLQIPIFDEFNIVTEQTPGFIDKFLYYLKFYIYAENGGTTTEKFNVSDNCVHPFVKFIIPSLDEIPDFMKSAGYHFDAEGKVAGVSMVLYSKNHIFKLPSGELYLILDEKAKLDSSFIWSFRKVYKVSKNIYEGVVDHEIRLTCQRLYSELIHQIDNWEKMGYLQRLDTYLEYSDVE